MVWLSLFRGIATDCAYKERQVYISNQKHSMNVVGASCTSHLVSITFALSTDGHRNRGTTKSTSKIPKADSSAETSEIR